MVSGWQRQRGIRERLLIGASRGVLYGKYHVLPCAVRLLVGAIRGVLYVQRLEGVKGRLTALRSWECSYGDRTSEEVRPF